MPVTAEPAPDPVVDAARVAAVAEATLAGAEGDGLERLVRMAARVLDVPVVMVSFVAGDREVVQAAVGLPEPWASRRTTPLTHSLCAHVVRLGGPVVLYDARADPGYREHAAVVEMGAGAYAGFPLRHDGHTLGAFCAADLVPRQWSPEDLLLLEDLAAAVSTELTLRIALRALRASEERLQELAQDLHEQSRTDPLTGAADRRRFDERLAEEVARIGRRPAPLALTLLGVDRSEEVDDRAGHQVGDTVLAEVASRIGATKRRVDLLARLGGDEFALLLPDTGLDAALQLAARVRRAVEERPVAGLPVTIASGTAAYEPSRGTGQLLADAGAALYAAKIARDAPAGGTGPADPAGGTGPA